MFPSPITGTCLKATALSEAASFYVRFPSVISKYFGGRKADSCSKVDGRGKRTGSQLMNSFLKGKFLHRGGGACAPGYFSRRIKTGNDLTAAVKGSLVDDQAAYSVWGRLNPDSGIPLFMVGV
jgi:hypothetical protein